jgi:hypothetical protein
MAARFVTSWQQRIKALYTGVTPYGGNLSTTNKDFGNNVGLSWSNAANDTSIEGIRVDTDGLIVQAGSAEIPIPQSMDFYLVANGSLANQTFFIADRAMVITGIQEVHGALGTDAGAVTGAVFKDTGTQGIGGGASTMVGTFNLKGTINTPQVATLLGVDGIGNPGGGIQLAAGDRLSFIFAGVLTSLANVVVSVAATPGFKEQPAIYSMLANVSLANQSFFLANRDMKLVGVNILYDVKGSDAGAVTIDLFHDTGTNAPDAGTSVLAAPISVKQTARTVYSAALAASAATLSFAASDRLSIKFNGVLTGLSGVCVVAYFQSANNGCISQIEKTYTMLANGSIATTSVFVADRDYEVVDFSGVWSTASGGGGTADLTIDKGTSAPGAGATSLSGAIGLAGAANTVVVAGLSASRRARLLSKGDRLTVKMAAIAATAGFTGTVSLLPR